MLPVEKYVKKHEEAESLRKFEQNSPKWKIEIMRLYTP